MKLFLKSLILITVVLSLLIYIIGPKSPNIKSKVYANGSDRYAKTNLNIRKDPSVKSKILKVLSLNERILTTDSVSNGFTMVLKGDSTQYGWASSNYLQDSPLTVEQNRIAINKKQKQIEAVKKKRKEKELEMNPLGIGDEVLKEIVYEYVPYHKWEEWGNPITLEGTDNDLWVVLLPKANISFVSRKKNDFVIFADFGKEKAIEFAKNEKKKNKANLKKNKASFKSQFSTWDGSNRYLTAYIKELMHDEDSYEHVKTVYWEYADHIVVETTFRGNNPYGAKVRQSVKAKIAANGEILEILEFF